MNHDHYCRTLKHSDAAKRISDTYALHRLADPIGNTGTWFACAIHDGTTDGVLYDSRKDAIMHMHHNETYYTYVQIVPSTMTVCAAEMYLAAVRKTYEARKNLMDRDHPKGGLEIIPRLAAEDFRAEMNGNPTNLIIPGRN
jgi:hypothetical protein